MVGPRKRNDVVKSFYWHLISDFFEKSSFMVIHDASRFKKQDFARYFFVFIYYFHCCYMRLPCNEAPSSDGRTLVLYSYMCNIRS